MSEDIRKIDIFQQMTIRYVLFLSVLAILSTAGYLLLDAVISNQTTAAAEINIAGRQRMLAGRIAFNSQQLLTSSGAEEAGRIVTAMQNDIKSMRLEHDGLTKGSAELGISAAASKNLLSWYFGSQENVAKKVTDYLALAESIVHPLSSSRDNQISLSRSIGEAYEELLPDLDQIVLIYQRDNENAINRLQGLQQLNLAVILSIIIISGLLVFRPMIIRMRKDELKKQKQEQQIRRTQKMDALGQLTGGVAHDYNNMLGVIIGYADLLENALNDQPKLAKYAHEINIAGNRGAKLTKKLLAFSRKDNAGLDTEKLNLNIVLPEQESMLEKVLTARIKLVFSLTNQPWNVFLDKSDIEDAILNISINAMHAMDSSGTLTIRTSNESLNAFDAHELNLTQGDYVSLTIIDTGTGMDKKTLDKIFDPFYSTKGDKGSGLGLSQVYAFVQRSGGMIKVYSEPGHGTQFSLYFPRHHDKGSYNKQEKKQDDINLNGNENILVVDDEPALLDSTSLILKNHGYTVFCAKNGYIAQEILETESIDLMLTDIIMPGMDGYELAAYVQEKYPNIDILLASGFADIRNKGMVDENLQENMLNKPYNSQTLLKKLRQLLDVNVSAH